MQSRKRYPSLLLKLSKHILKAYQTPFKRARMSIAKEGGYDLSFFDSSSSHFFQCDIVDVDDDWIDSLLPLSRTSFKIGIKDRKDTTLHYQRAYRTMASENSSAGEHLSNEEWAALRMQREQRLQQMQNRQLQQNRRVMQEEDSTRFSGEFRLSLLSYANRPWGQAQRMNHEQFDMFVDRELLLFQALEEAGRPYNELNRQQRYRDRSHEVHGTSQAQREPSRQRLESLFSRTSRLLFQPWRSISRNHRNNLNSVTFEAWNGQADSSSIDDLSSIDEDQTIQYGISPSWDANETHVQLFGDDDMTAYWSTGTAMETDSECDSSRSSIRVDRETLVAYPESISLQEELSRTALRSEQSWFPEDPFDSCNFL